MIHIPIELQEANTFIQQHHRHHRAVIGHRYSLGCIKNGKLVGVVVVGRPVARGCDHKRIVEVTRLCTDGTKNACSYLYSAAARVARAMNFVKIQTYILQNEDGASLKAAGWVHEQDTVGGVWDHTSGPRRVDQPNNPKQRWCLWLKPESWHERLRLEFNL